MEKAVKSKVRDGMRRMGRRDFLKVSALAAAGLALGGCGRLGRPREKLNLVMLISDTLRADHVWALGARRRITPNIDALAGRGVALTNMMSSAANTNAAHASIMTGTYQTRHKVIDNPYKMSGEVETLAEVLARSGYETAAFVSNAVLGRKLGIGFDRGFGVYDDEAKGICGWRDAPDTAAAAVEWLRQAHDDPFFLWVHMMEPHGPYVVYEDKFFEQVGEFEREEGEPEKLEVLKGNFGQNGIPRYQARYGMEEVREPARLRRHYAARAAYMDHYLGQVLEEIERQGLQERTVVIFLGDHGEFLGEHYYFFQHSITVLNPVLHVPCVVAGPGIEGSSRREELVGSVDIAPTLLEMLGVEGDGVFADKCQGRSLAESLKKKREIAEGAYFAICPQTEAWAVMMGRHKYTMTPETERLVDMGADPQEKRDIKREDTETAAGLHGMLGRFRAEAPRLLQGFGKDKIAPLDEETRRNLRSLGYLE